jgi:outer membrane protein
MNEKRITRTPATRRLQSCVMCQRTEQRFDSALRSGATLVLSAACSLLAAPGYAQGTSNSPAPEATHPMPVPNVEAQTITSQQTTTGGADPQARPTATSLTLSEAITQALGGNPAISAAQYDEKAASQQLRAEIGRYPYAVLGDAGFTRTESPQLRADNSVASSTNRSVDASVALSKPFAFGGVAEVRATEQYFTRDILAVTVSPFLPASSGHAATLRASVSQPFLRGFGTDIGEVELRAARSNLESVGQTLTREKSALARDVSVAYYELWYAAKVLEIDHASLALAQEQERQTNERVELGQLAMAEILTFQTRSAELQESVVASKLALAQRSIALSQLMGVKGPLASEFSPSSEPYTQAELPGAAAVERAIASNSIELAQLEAQVRTNQVRAEVAGDASRPRLDGNAYIQSTGMSDNIPNAWRRAAGFDWWSAHVGVTVELPTDTSRQQALAAQANYNVLSAQAQLEATRQRVAADALTAIETARAARERLQSAERTLAIAERSFEAAKVRFELGQTVAITVQQAEDDLRRARLRVVRARVDIAQQQASIDHLTGVLAQRYETAR